jgi:hypothetical protein
MDQLLIVLFLSMKGLCAKDIHGEHAAVLDSDAIGYSTVTNHFRQNQIPPFL